VGESYVFKQVFDAGKRVSGSMVTSLRVITLEMGRSVFMVQSFSDKTMILFRKEGLVLAPYRGDVFVF